METRETITLDGRTQHRLDVLNHVLSGALSEEEAARLLGLSRRQVGRLLTRYRTAGAAGLVHGNRGRRPAHRIADELRSRIVELATTRYAGANQTHLSELLSEREALSVPVRTLRRILASEGVRPVRTRRPPRHRSRRERMAKEGLLLQVDGSRHRWFGSERPFVTLVGGIDDATGAVTGGTFRAAEDAVGYFTTFAQTADRFGLPVGVYSDRHGIFIVEKNRPLTITEQLTGKRGFTQVGRALEEAGIRWIGAGSAQAKGRVERLWGTLQDRLVIELRLEGITTIKEANAFLPAFLRRHNARFAVPPADPISAWRPWPDGLDSASVFCFHYPRRVARDATISWPGGPLALPRRPDGRSWAGRSVTLQERLDGSLWVSHDGLCLPLELAPPSPAQLRARHLSRLAEGRLDLQLELLERTDIADTEAPDPAPPKTRRRPGPDHPWRR